MADLAEALRKLSDLTPRLNATTDAVNAAFRGVEDHLQAIGIGIDAGVTVGRVEAAEKVRRGNGRSWTESTETLLDLVYCRIGGKFRIGLQERTLTSVGTDFVSQDEKPPVAWDQAVRQMKLMSVGKLPDLVEDIVVTAGALAASAEAATSAVSELLASVASKTEKVPAVPPTGLVPQEIKDGLKTLFLGSSPRKAPDSTERSQPTEKIKK